MLTNYIQAAMRKAHYEILPVPRSEDPDLIGNGEGYFGSIPDLQGVWANADTLEVCREELREVLEEWILIGLKMGHSIPQINGIELNVREFGVGRGTEELHLYCPDAASGFK